MGKDQDLFRTPTSSKKAVWNAGKPWMTGTSPVKGAWSCSRVAANNQFPVQHFTAAVRRCVADLHNLWLPLAGLGPATHVFERGSLDGWEGVDCRAEPGHGDPRLCRARHKQPTSLNRRAIGQARPRGFWVVLSAPQMTGATSTGQPGGGSVHDAVPAARMPGVWEVPAFGVLRAVPALARGMSAQCVRCPTTLRRTSAHRPDHIAALVVAAFVLLVVMCSTNLMSVETVGIKRTADLFSGPEELVRRNMAALGAMVVFVTLLAPLGRLISTLYVLIRLHESRPPHHLRRVFAWAERLRPWSMVEVFVFGVFVAYVKLGDLVTIGLLPG